MTKKYYEVVVEGSFDLIKGFVIGFLRQGHRGRGRFLRGASCQARRRAGTPASALDAPGRYIQHHHREGIGLLLQEAWASRFPAGPEGPLHPGDHGGALQFQVRTYSKKAGMVLRETSRIPPGWRWSASSWRKMCGRKARESRRMRRFTITRSRKRTGRWRCQGGDRFLRPHRAQRAHRAGRIVLEYGKA